MKSAEFTDYTSAAAFIAAGRKKGERNTSDGWNTVLYERGSKFVLELQGTPIVEYTSTETRIAIPMRNHVVADRIQRYGLGDGFQLTTVGSKWSLSQAWGTMVGLNEDPTIWLPMVNELPTEIVIDSAGTLLLPATAPMPSVLGPVQRVQIREAPIKKWLGVAMKQLDAGWSFDRDQWKACPLCDAIDVPGGTMLGWAASQTHLLSHVLEGVVLPSTVAGLAAASPGGNRHLSLTVDGSGNGQMGGTGVYYNHTSARRILKNMLNLALR